MALADEKYMLLTTFRRDGTPVSTPVWVVALDGGELAFWTSSGSGKAKRLANTPRVTVQACDFRGNLRPGSDMLDATARIVDGEQLAEIRKRVVSKYGFMTRVTAFIGTVAGTLRGKRIPYGDRGVIVTPDA